MRVLLQWLKANSVLLVNAGSLVGTSAVTSLLGFIYWWVAARQFPPEAVGIASASISAMTLLGGFGILGLGTLLITELPRQPGHEGELISTALIVVGGVSGCVGIVFAVVAPYVSAGFKPLGANLLDVVIFASGVILTSIVLVLDQALVALLRGELQLWRNTLFAVIKLAALLVVGLLVAGRGSITIYATWAMGNILSLMALAVLLVFKNGWPGREYLPQWGLLRKLGFAALQHHFLNLTLQVSVLILPMLVTALLSSTMNAWFYVAWMIANFLFLIPYVLTVVLHAMNAAQQSTLAHKARVTIGLAFVTGLLVNCLLQLATKQVLSFFGGSYVQATWCLRVLLLAVFPLTIKNHYISICRIQDRVTQAMLAMLPGGLLEISAAALGGHLGGLTGLSVGWVSAIYIESMFTFRAVYKTVFPSKKSALSTELQYKEAQALWLMDTTELPIIGQSHMAGEAPWLINTSTVAIVRLPTIGQANRELNGNKQSLPDGANRGNRGGRRRLKPLQLQPYTPHHSRIPITDSDVNSQFLEKICDHSTTFEDEVI